MTCGRAGRRAEWTFHVMGSRCRNSVDISVPLAHHPVPMALVLASQLMLGGTAPSSFGVIACQPGLRLGPDPRLGRGDASYWGIPAVRL